MKDDTQKEVSEKKSGVAKPLSFHPLTMDAAFNRLLQVKPEPKPEKKSK